MTYFDAGWWNNAAENWIAGVLGLVPEVGSVLSGLVYIFWPQSGEDVWAEMEQQVEDLVDKKIDQLVYEDAMEAVAGLQNVLNDYLSAVQTGDTTNISTQWIAAREAFSHDMPQFQATGYQFLLLPMFVQVVNMNLALLRDGVLFGSSWGWNEAYTQSIVDDLSSKIKSFSAYANQIYQEGYQQVVASTPTNYNECQPFRSVNAYVRSMTLGILDFVQLWAYFDTTAYPPPVTIYLDREIYSDPQGTCTDSGAINLPSPPTQPISQFSVWAWDRIDAVQVTYPASGGPGGVTETARMGDQSGGSNQPPHGGVFNVSTNPVTIAAGLSGSILNAFTFTFKDGTNSGQLGGNYDGGSAFSYSYANELLSSIHINGVSNYYGSADCAVFGFKYDPAATININTLRTLYIASPTPLSLEQAAARSGAKPIGVDELTATATAEAWDAQRQTYWAYLNSQTSASDA